MHLSRLITHANTRQLADSVSCINQLAARGSTGCHIPYGGAPLITVGLAQIYGVTINHAGSILPW
jgi:hypothetical protein